MLSRLVTWWRGRQRKIFRYHNGHMHCGADPLVVQRKLDSAGGDNWPALFSVLAVPTSPLFEKMPPEAAAAAIRDANKAAEELAVIVRKAFDIVPYGIYQGREGGLTEAECLELLASFLRYLTSLEEEARPSQSLPQPTDASQAANSPTESSSACTPGGEGSSSSEPMRS